jgi:hypothetical protein
VRVLAATKRVVEEDVKVSKFRQHLYYPLTVIRIEVRPLRVRREDVTVLARYFLGRASRAHPAAWNKPSALRRAQPESLRRRNRAPRRVEQPSAPRPAEPERTARRAQPERRGRKPRAPRRFGRRAAVCTRGADSKNRVRQAALARRVGGTRRTSAARSGTRARPLARSGHAANPCVREHAREPETRTRNPNPKPEPETRTRTARAPRATGLDPVSVPPIPRHLLGSPSLRVRNYDTNFVDDAGAPYERSNAVVRGGLLVPTIRGRLLTPMYCARSTPILSTRTSCRNRWTVAAS